MVDGSEIVSPDFTDDGGSYPFVPTSQDAAMILELIRVRIKDTKLPTDIQTRILHDMEGYINNMSMTNITQGQVNEFLGGYKEIWMKYRIFEFRKKYWKELNTLETRIREIFIQNCNKSINGLLIDRVFIRKHDYDVKQSNKSVVQPSRAGFFGRRKKQEQVEEGV